MSALRSLPWLLLLVPLACSSGTGDAPVPLDGGPPPAGKDQRISDVAFKVDDGTAVKVSGTVVTAVDTYDETGDGKSSGTIYVADLDSQLPYSGIGLYQPSFIPGNLSVGVGDALDLNGTYFQKNNTPIPFEPSMFLVQISTPIATFRFETAPPTPVVVEHIEDLLNYDTGRQWMNMLVTFKNVTLVEEPDLYKGRLTARLLEDTTMPRSPACTASGPKAPALVNELMDLSGVPLHKGTVIKSLTGVVSFFCNLHIAPRTAADVVL